MQGCIKRPYLDLPRFIPAPGKNNPRNTIVDDRYGGWKGPPGRTHRRNLGMT